MKKNKDSEVNSSIKCNVESCKHNDSEKGSCTLNEIEVDCTCDSCDCTETGETICKSFDCDKKENSEEQDKEDKEEE